MNTSALKPSPDSVVTAGQLPLSLRGVLATDSSLGENRDGLHEEIRQLWFELERLRNQQRALRRTPPSNESEIHNDDVETNKVLTHDRAARLGRAEFHSGVM
jgi:hypothetical protein